MDASAELSSIDGEARLGAVGAVLKDKQGIQQFGVVVARMEKARRRTKRSRKFVQGCRVQLTKPDNANSHIHYGRCLLQKEGGWGKRRLEWGTLNALLPFFLNATAVALGHSGFCGVLRWSSIRTQGFKWKRGMWGPANPA